MEDNTSSEAWTKKGCTASRSSHAIGRLQCALMIDTPISINAAYVSTKDNKIADEISWIKKLINLIPSIAQNFQEFPQLKCCRRFPPSASVS